jgi:hypothetical protein
VGHLDPGESLVGPLDPGESLVGPLDPGESLVGPLDPEWAKEQGKSPDGVLGQHSIV